jgi:hypothetical protein
MADEDPNADVDWENNSDEEMESEEEYDYDSGEGDDDDDSREYSNSDVIDGEIVETFIRKFHTGGYDVELDNSLCYDRGVTLPVRPTQASYTKPDDWIERNRIGLEKIQVQLQSCIDWVSHDTSFNLELIHNGPGIQLMDNEEPIVWNEPILDEYWNQLDAKMKQLRNVRQIGHIKIMNVEMKKERLATLVTALSGQINTLEYILFNNTNLCAEGIVCLSKLVDVSSKLHQLIISHNRIDNMELVCCLTSSIRSHNCIAGLTISHCDLGSSPEILSVILQSGVEYISLVNNNIDSLGAVKIAEYLESDPPIHQIDLAHNRLNDDDAILISQALKRNAELKAIRLHTNNFTSIGVKALLTCVFDGSSLNAISESNHTLTRIDMFHNHNDKLAFCTEILIQLDCPHKIMLALQDKDSLLQYLANVPVGLIPEVIAFSLRRVDDQCQHKHLNITYSTMRWWNMPMLYSYYNCVNSDSKRKRDN